MRLNPKRWLPVEVHHGEYVFGGGDVTVVLYRNIRTGETKTRTLNGTWDAKHFGFNDGSNDRATR